MSDDLIFRANSASVAEVADHLQECDSSFVPPLSERVDISAYARKLATLAVRFECWDGALLVGLVASYDNDSARPSAFVTSVSTTISHQGRGIATRLLRQCVAHASRLGARAVVLEASAAQASALRLYEKIGFKQQSQRESILTLCLDLAKVGT